MADVALVELQLEPTQTVAPRDQAVEDPGMCVSSSTGIRETSTLAAREASGPRREGDEPKPAMHEAEESDCAMSHCEASERGRAADELVEPKGGGQGECGPANHAGTEPGTRVTGAGTHTAGFAVRYRREPDALIGPVRFCAGGAQQ